MKDAQQSFDENTVTGREIRTERLVLRCPRPVDTQAFTNAANNLNLAKWLTLLPHPYRLEDARDFINKCQASPEGNYAIFKGGTFVGMISSGKEFGYWIAEEFWGNGYASEAGRAVLFDYFQHNNGPLLSGYFPGNHASQRVLEKLGFQSAPDRDDVRVMTGQPQTVTGMVITRAQWEHHTGLRVETARLTLRPLQRSDLAALQKAADNIDVARWLSNMPHPYTMQEALEFFERNQKERNPALGVFDHRGFVGCLRLKPVLSYWLAQHAWRKGYATEMVQAVLSAHFKCTETAVEAGYIKDNLASKNLLERLGFEPTEPTKFYSTIRGCEVTNIGVRLDKNTWLASRNAARLSANGGRRLIKTGRMVLRQIRTSDFEALHQMNSDYDVVKMTSSWPYPGDEVFTRMRMNTREAQAGLVLVIEVDGIVAGSIGLIGAVLGYMLAQPYWGRGLMTEAVQALISDDFENTDLDYVTACVWLENPASARVLEKRGFVKAGTNTCLCKARGVELVSQQYVLMRADWESSNV